MRPASTSIVVLLLLHSVGAARLSLQAEPPSFLHGVAPVADFYVASAVSRIAFGSCHDLSRGSAAATAALWQSLLDEDEAPVFVWTGDVVYADTRPLGVWLPYSHPSPIEVVRQRFAAMRSYAPYAAFAERKLVLGVSDDHDSNCNNGDGRCSADPLVKAALLDFLDEPDWSPRRRRPGLYASALIGATPAQLINLIVLDTRSFRVVDGDLLGDDQWRWLAAQLASPLPRVHVVVSSVQVLPPDKPVVEAWIHHPDSLRRLLDLVDDAAAARGQRVVLVSGDVHSAEIMRDDCTAAPFGLYELTASGMTHAIRYFVRYAQSRLSTAYYIENNYGAIAFDWQRDTLQLHVMNTTGHRVLASPHLPMAAAAASLHSQPPRCTQPIVARESPLRRLAVNVWRAVVDWIMPHHHRQSVV